MLRQPDAPPPEPEPEPEGAPEVEDYAGWLPEKVVLRRRAGAEEGDGQAALLRVTWFEVGGRERQIEGSGGSLEPPGPLS